LNGIARPVVRRLPAVAAGQKVRVGEFRSGVGGDGLGDESVKLILTDIPYDGGVVPQVDDLAALADRVLAEGGVFVTYAGQIQLYDVMDRLARYLTFRWVGCVSWNEGGNRVHARQVTSRWKPVLIYSKGDWQPRPYWTDLLFSDGKPNREPLVERGVTGLPPGRPRGAGPAGGAREHERSGVPVAVYRIRGRSARGVNQSGAGLPRQGRAP
jgi:hypothetical protein